MDFPTFRTQYNAAIGRIHSYDRAQLVAKVRHFYPTAATQSMDRFALRKLLTTKVDETKTKFFAQRKTADIPVRINKILNANALPVDAEVTVKSANNVAGDFATRLKHQINALFNKLAATYVFSREVADDGVDLLVCYLSIGGHGNDYFGWRHLTDDLKDYAQDERLYWESFHKHVDSASFNRRCAWRTNVPRRVRTVSNILFNLRQKYESDDEEEF